MNYEEIAYPKYIGTPYKDSEFYAKIVINDDMIEKSDFYKSPL